MRPGLSVDAMPPKILIVDDTPHNVKMLVDLLSAKGYETVTAASGQDGLDQLEAERPDLVLLDVMMPGMDGYEVCRRIRANPEYGILPVVMVTALDPAGERIKGLEAGADDFLTKPVNMAELVARVRSLLRIKDLYGTVQAQAAELADLNANLEQRVQAQVAQLERLGRLKRFFSPQLAELIVTGGAEDPLEVPDARERAVRMAVAMRGRVEALVPRWRQRGYDLHFGVGIANGFATLGAIGFEGRWDYGAIGPVSNLAARLCSEAKPGQILVSRTFLSAVEAIVTSEPVGELVLKGFAKPVSAFNVLDLRGG